MCSWQNRDAVVRAYAQPSLLRQKFGFAGTWDRRPDLADHPPGQPGSADVFLFLSDAEMELIPEGFSYGPTILEVSPNYSTAEGGGTGVIYGYGFGPVNSNAVPSGLSVNVGGQLATITGFNANSYNILGQPFLLQSIYYKIPPGSAENASDVSVTSSSGTTTANEALTY